MTYKPEGTDQIRSLLENTPGGFSLQNLMNETCLGADDVLKALSSLNAFQDGQNWCLHNIAPIAHQQKEDSNSPLIRVLNCIKEQREKGASIDQITTSTGVATSSFYVLIKKLLDSGVIYKVKPQRIAYFVHKNFEFKALEQCKKANVPVQLIEKQGQQVCTSANQKNTAIESVLKNTKTVTTISQQLYLDKFQLENWLKQVLGFTSIAWVNTPNGSLEGIMLETIMEKPTC